MVAPTAASKISVQLMPRPCSSLAMLRPDLSGSDSHTYTWKSTWRALAAFRISRTTRDLEWVMIT
jgi:hypothetical protein